MLYVTRWVDAALECHVRMKLVQGAQSGPNTSRMITTGRAAYLPSNASCVALHRHLLLRLPKARQMRPSVKRVDPLRQAASYLTTNSTRL